MTDVLSALGRVVVFAPVVIAIAVLPYCLPATAGAANPFGRYVYVTDPGSIPSGGKLYRIDVEHNFRVEGPVEVGPGAKGVTVSSLGSKIFVADSFSEKVSIVDARVFDNDNRASQTIEAPVGIRPTAVAATPDPEESQRFYVANTGSNDISVIDENGDQIHEPIDVGVNPINLVVTPDGKYVYVSNNGSNTVSVINTDTGEVDWEIPVRSPDGISVTPDGSKVYVAARDDSYQPNPLNSKIAVISTDTQTITSTVELGQVSPPMDIAVNPAGSHVMFTKMGGNLFSIMKTSDNSIENVAITQPLRLALSPNGGSAYITQGNVSKVSVMNTSNRSIETIPLNVTGGIVATPNLSPVAVLAVDARPAGEPTRFDGSRSYDDYGRVAGYTWNFGDGSREEVTLNPTTSHIYENPGNYTVALTAKDNEGLTMEKSVWAGKSYFEYGSPLARTSRVINIESAKPGPDQDPDTERPGFVYSDSYASVGSVGGEGVQSPASCVRPELKTTLKAPREVRLSDIAKGKSVTAQASGSSAGKGKIQLSITGRDARKLGLFTGKSKQKEKRLATESVSVSQSERTIGLKVAAGQRVRLKRALKSRRRKLPKTVKLKVTLVAKAAVSGRTLQSRSSLTVRGRSAGKIQRRTQINKRSIRGVSPCAKQLKLKLKAPGDVKLKRLVTRGAKAGKGISPRVWCSNDCTGTVEMRIWGRHGRALRLYRSKSKTKNKLLARKKVRLHAGTYKGLTLRISSRSLRKILAKAYRRRDGLPERVKAQILFKAGTEEGVNGHAAKTLRVKLRN